jgi:hypothetical protein
MHSSSPFRFFFFSFWEQEKDKSGIEKSWKIIKGVGEWKLWSLQREL